MPPRESEGHPRQVGQPGLAPELGAGDGRARPRDQVGRPPPQGPQDPGRRGRAWPWASESWSPWGWRPFQAGCLDTKSSVGLRAPRGLVGSHASGVRLPHTRELRAACRSPCRHFWVRTCSKLKAQFVRGGGVWASASPPGQTRLGRHFCPVRRREGPESEAGVAGDGRRRGSQARRRLAQCPCGCPVQLSPRPFALVTSQPIQLLSCTEAPACPLLGISAGAPGGPVRGGASGPEEGGSGRTVCLPLGKGPVPEGQDQRGSGHARGCRWVSLGMETRPLGAAGWKAAGRPGLARELLPGSRCGGSMGLRLPRTSSRLDEALSRAALCRRTRSGPVVGRSSGLCTAPSCGSCTGDLCPPGRRDGLSTKPATFSN